MNFFYKKNTYLENRYLNIKNGVGYKTNSIYIFYILFLKFEYYKKFYQYYIQYL